MRGLLFVAVIAYGAGLLTATFSTGDSQWLSAYFGRYTVAPATTTSCPLPVAPPPCPACPVPEPCPSVKVTHVPAPITTVCAVLSGQQLMIYGRPRQPPGKSMALIVPFRDREAQLAIFSNFMYSFFKNYINYKMFIIDQVKGQPFNRAMLLNIGFVETERLYPGVFDYVCFHDVDMLPAEPTNDYTFPADGPRYMYENPQNWNWTTPSHTIFAGVVCITRDQMRLMNGWSNEYWGWGAEDEDAWRRTGYVGLKVQYPVRTVWWKLFMSHTRDTWDNALYEHNKQALGEGWKTWKDTGLNTIGGRYQIMSHRKEELYERILVSLDWAKTRSRINYLGTIY